MYAHLYQIKGKFPRGKKMLRTAKGAEMKSMFLTAASMCYAQIFNGAGLCQFGMITSAVPLFEYLNAVTGWSLTPDDYLTIGERILNLRKAFNMREGLRPADIKLHPRAAGATPLSAGPLKGVSLDMDALEKAFYAFTGWDSATGGPTKQKLAELGIDRL